MKKYIVPLLLVLFVTVVFAQYMDTTRRTRDLAMTASGTSTAATIVYADPDTLSLTFLVAASTNDTFVAAFPWQSDSYSYGNVSLYLTIEDTIYIQAWGYPMRKTSIETDSSITLKQTLLHQLDDTVDSLAIMSDTLDGIGEHRLDWGTRASGDDLSWGPCDGLMIIFNWQAAVETGNDTSLVWTVEAQ